MSDSGFLGRPHPKGPLAKVKYESYLRRYKKSAELAPRPVFKYDLWVGNVMICNSLNCPLGTHSYNWLRVKNANPSVDTASQTNCSISGTRKNIDQLSFEKVTNGNCGGILTENVWTALVFGAYSGLFSGEPINNLGEFKGDLDYWSNPFFYIEEKWIVNNYEVFPTGTPATPSYTCNCPDFTQNTEGSPAFTDIFSVSRWSSILRGRRSWAGSNAGPFNPCKHIMAVKRYRREQQSYTGYP